MKQEIPIACCHTVFTKEQRRVYKDTWTELTKRRLAIKETDNEFEYRFTDESDTLHLLFEWISMERQCCPFLTFTVKTSHEGEPIILELSGNEEAKAFLRNEFNDKIQMIAGVDK